MVKHSFPMKLYVKEIIDGGDRYFIASDTLDDMPNHIGDAVTVHEYTRVGSSFKVTGSATRD